MTGLEAEIPSVLRQPQLVRRSVSDPAVRMFTISFPKPFLVANGCVLWLSIAAMMHL